MVSTNLLPLKKLDLFSADDFLSQKVLNSLADPDLWDYKELYKRPRSEWKTKESMSLKLIDYLRKEKTLIEIIEEIRNDLIEEITLSGVRYLYQDRTRDFWHDSCLCPINKIRLSVTIHPNGISLNTELTVDYNGPKSWDILFVPKNN